MRVVYLMSAIWHSLSEKCPMMKLFRGFKRHSHILVKVKHQGMCCNFQKKKKHEYNVISKETLGRIRKLFLHNNNDFVKWIFKKYFPFSIDWSSSQNMHLVKRAMKNLQSHQTQLSNIRSHCVNSNESQNHGN